MNVEKEKRNYHNIVEDITNRKDITIKFTEKRDDNKLFNSSIAFTAFEEKLIVITKERIPKYLLAKEDKSLINEYIQGLLVHEAGHWKYTLKENVNLKRDSHLGLIDEKENEYHVSKKQVVKILLNIIYDKIVDSNIELDLRYNYGNKLKFSNKIIRKGFKNDIKNVSPEIKEILNNIFNFITFENLYKGDKKIRKNIIKQSDLDKNKKEKINNILNEINDHLDDLSFEIAIKPVREKFDKIYDLIIELYDIFNIPFLNLKIKDNTINNVGGNKTIQGDKEISIDEENKEKNNTNKKEDSIFNEIELEGYGKGNGENIPTPPYNTTRWDKIISRNITEVNKILNNLEKSITLHMNKKRNTKKGRLMSEKLTNMVLQSKINPLIKTKSRIKEKKGKEKPYIAILTDLSGSMNQRKAEDVLSIITEIGSEWLENKKFSNIVFARNYQKIVSFNENNDIARGRVGGIKDGDLHTRGTKLSKPLEEYKKLFKQISDINKTKLFIIVTDYRVYSEDLKESKKHLEKIRDTGVQIMSINIGNVKKENKNEIIKKEDEEVYINDLTELPEKFIEKYITLCQKKENTFK
ncbi:MAG: vWA domain-containing protein [archaeon]